MVAFQLAAIFFLFFLPSIISFLGSPSLSFISFSSLGFFSPTGWVSFFFFVRVDYHHYRHSFQRRRLCADYPPP